MYITFLLRSNYNCDGCGISSHSEEVIISFHVSHIQRQAVVSSVKILCSPRTVHILRHCILNSGTYTAPSCYQNEHIKKIYSPKWESNPELFTLRRIFIIIIILALILTFVSVAVPYSSVPQINKVLQSHIRQYLKK